MLRRGVLRAKTAIVEDHARMRALIVTNMWPSSVAPARGSFVRDQVASLRALDGVEVEVFAFPPKGYLRAARDLRARHGATRFDVVHAHFGLTAWPALRARARARAVTLHGTDLRHPRSRQITRAALGRYDLVAAVSPELAREVPGAGARRAVAVLPCGVDLDRFRPLSRAGARERLGLAAGARVLLFPADPARAAKRADRARELADAAGAQLLALGGVDPGAVPAFVNAADAVVVPSEHEGFGLAVLEALACDVPVLATPVGNHPTALEGVDGTLCAPYDRERWLAALEPHLGERDARVAGRERAGLWSARRMAGRVAIAWAELSGAVLPSPAEAPEGAVLT
jgi:teichuronic acid biosynthesis glycosyltransferase TuaC